MCSSDLNKNMVSTTTLQVIIQAKDQLTSKVNEINNKLKNTGTTASNAMNQTKNATNQASNALKNQGNNVGTVQSKYNQLKSTVTNAFNQIKQAIINSSPAKYITSSSIAQPFKNAAETIKNKWQQTMEQIKSKYQQSMQVMSYTKINPGVISNAGLATLNGQITTTQTKTSLLQSAFNRVGQVISTIGSKGVTAFGTLQSKISGAGAKITNLASGLSGVQGLLMSAFSAVGVSSLKSFTIEAAIAREKVNAVTQSITGSQAAFTATQKSIKSAIAGTTLGYNNMATAVNNVALRFHMTGESLQALPGPMAKVGILAQAMGKSSSEAASIMEHAFDGLQGKWRSLKTLGITEDDLKAAGWSGAAEDVEGYAAALDKVLEKNPKFKEFTSTFEYQFEAFKMSIKGVGTEIGLVLLPILKSVLSFITDISKNHPELFKLAVVIGVILLALTSFATAVLPIIMVVQAIKELEIATALWNAVTKIATAAQAALNLVMEMNPIMIVVLAIIALIAILWYLYNTNEDVRNALNGLWEFLQGTFAGVWEWLSGLISGCGDAIGGFMDWLGLLYDKFMEVLPLIMAVLMPWSIMFDENIRNVAIQAVQTFVEWISTLGSQVWTWLMDVINKVIQWGVQLVQNMSTTATNAVNGFISYISGLPAAVWNYLNMVIQKAINFHTAVVAAIIQAAKDLVKGFADKIKEMPQKMLDELKNIKDNIVNYASQLWQAAKDLAWNAIQGFITGLDHHSPGIMARTMEQESLYINILKY